MEFFFERILFHRRFELTLLCIGRRQRDIASLMRALGLGLSQRDLNSDARGDGIIYWLPRASSLPTPEYVTLDDENGR